MNKREYNDNYIRDNIKAFSIKLNKRTDSDIIQWLESKDRYSVYIKELIKKDMLQFLEKNKC